MSCLPSSEGADFFHPSVPLLWALWPLCDGIWGILEGSWVYSKVFEVS